MILSCPNCAARFRVKPEALGAQGRTVKCAKCAHKWFARPDEADGEAPAPAAAAAKTAPAPASAPKPAPRPEPKAEPAAPPPDDDLPPPAFAADAGSRGGPVEQEDDAPPPPPPPRSDGTALDEPPLGPDEEIVVRQRAPKTVKKSPLGAWIVLAVLVLGVLVGGFFFRHDIVKAYRPANAIFSAIGFPVDTLGFGLELPDPERQAIIDGDRRELRIRGEIRNTTADPIAAPLLRGALRDAQENELYVWTFRAEEERILPGESVTYDTSVVNPPRGAVGLRVTFTRPEEVEAEIAPQKPAEAMQQEGAPQGATDGATDGDGG